MNGTVAFPPPPVITPVPLAPVPVGPGEAVEFKSGNPNGFPLGVMVVLFPITICGALIVPKSGADVIVEDPLNVSVRVVKISDRVVVLSGRVDVGFVVGARVVDMAANATPVKYEVVVVVRLVTCARAVPLGFSPAPWQRVKPMKLMNCCSPARSRVTCPLAEDRVSEKAVGRVDTKDVVEQIPFTGC